MDHAWVANVPSHIARRSALLNADVHVHRRTGLGAFQTLQKLRMRICFASKFGSFRDARG